MTDYPPLPFTPRDVPAALYPEWWAATQLDAWLVDWHDGDLLTCYPPALEVGHDTLCTARYDAEGVCHELAGCVLVDADPEPEVPPCTCKPARRTIHGWSFTVVRRSSSRVRINPGCWHHGDGYRW